MSCQVPQTPLLNSNFHHRYPTKQEIFNCFCQVRINSMQIVVNWCQYGSLRDFQGDQIQATRLNLTTGYCGITWLPY